MEESSSRAGPPATRRAFISYSRANNGYLDRLMIHLKGALYDEQDRYIIWSDRDIESGTPWEAELRQALTSASVAILLVSADFLASKYIREHELPVLCQAAENGNVTLLSFVLSPCAIKETELIRYQIVNNPDGSFRGLNKYRQERQWMELVQHILKLLRAH